MPARRPRTRRILRVALGLAVLAFAIEGGEYGTSDLVRQRRERARLTREIDSLTTTNDSLRRYRVRLERDARLQERIAREEFGMVRRGELLYRFIEPGDDNPPGRPRR